MNKTIVRTYLLGLHEQIIASLESLDGKVFSVDSWERPQGSMGITCVLENGNIFERAGVNFSHVKGESLPASASENRRRLAGSSYEAMGVSLVLHPRNPYCPTVHLNVRYFEARHAPKFDAAAPSRFAASPLRSKEAGDDSHAASARQTTWWFGGGMDLTPYYPFEEDVRHFHQTCHDAVAPLGESLPLRFKRACDEYFYLKHREEARGVGGLFFDDFNEQSFEHSFEVMKSVGDAFLSAYLPIVRLRNAQAYGERERDFQAYRRGRYAEFNLALDRGTQFGLQSGGRTESILVSMPPTASWRYDWAPEPGSPEARLYEEFLKPRDWI